jgi:hydroxymethylbilane synthase
LPHGAHVGTSALRREAQLRALRPDLRVSSLRGNVDTRIRKLEEGHYDAILLAAAGLIRLGWQAKIAELVPIDVICPAVGQGALAVETREGDTRFTFLDHEPTRKAVAIERAFLRAMGGGCQVPMGAHFDGETLRCAVAEPDGTRLRKFVGTGERLVERAIEAVR